MTALQTFFYVTGIAVWLFVAYLFLMVTLGKLSIERVEKDD